MAQQGSSGLPEHKRDGGQGVDEDLTVNWPKSPPTGTEGDPAVFAERDHECKVLKGFISISNPSLTDTEKWERCALSW